MIALTAASLVWLAGCETTSSLNPFKHISAIAPADPDNPDATNTLASAETANTPAGADTTGTVTKPGNPPATPELLGADPNDDLSIAKKYFRQGSYGLAETRFRKAVELHPKDAEAWLGLAASYDRLKRFDLADRAYTQAIRLVGATPAILNNQGFSYMLRGEYRRARTTLLAAQAKDPANPYVQNNLQMLDEVVRKRKAVN